MDVSFLTRQLADNAARINALIQGVSPREATWRPNRDAWSILEVVNHLYDEEKEDFRVRLDIILHLPDRIWPRIDPEGWVTEREYNERDLEESARSFVRERDASLAWLKRLETPNWGARYQADFGLITAGDMFASWVTHDHIHMRQIIELHRALTVQNAEPYQQGYAGTW